MKNIQAVMNMTREFINGEMSLIDYMLDFPHEVYERIRAMRRENSQYADLIWTELLEDGVYELDRRKLSDQDFLVLIKKQYERVREIADEGFL
jgi:hypothetical protein